MFAKVVVDIKSSNVDIMYTYRIPNELEEFVGIGSRVLVNFGIRKILGYVIEITEKCDYDGEVKEIIEVLDYSQELTKEQVELAIEIKNETKCLLVYALEAMYPSFLKTKYRKYVYAYNLDNLDAEIALLFNGKNKIALQTDTLKKYPKISREIKKGNLVLEHDIFHYGKRKKEKLYRINPSYSYMFNTLSSRRLEIIRFVEKNENCTSNDIKEAIGCSIFLIQALVKDEYLLVTEDFINIEKEEKPKKVLRQFNFSFEQRNINEKFETLADKPFLLYSNDETFKYDFYLNQSIKMVNNGKKVLIVTPTLFDNFKVVKYFKRYLEGYKILSFSNDLSNADYYNQYMQVLKNNFDIIITTKVGALLPINDLGMIIVLNENDFNYLNEYTPKYNLVKLLEFRSRYHKGKLVLSPNSLQIEEYNKYINAKYILLKHLIKLDNKKILVDLNQEYGETNSLISNRLQLEIDKCLKNHQQVVLMLNLKGYSNYLVCRNCGEVLKCPKCEIPLTYYKEKDETKCKYCGRKAEEVSCSKCGGKMFTRLGSGLDNLKEKLQILFPQTNILQMDSDTIKTTADYHEALLMIENQDADIIIGTRNVFSIFSNQIRLLGIINIDQFLNSNDYRSNENTFSLITECFLHTECTTIIQGYHLDNKTVINAINNDFDSFYEREMKYRQDFLYPPYCEVNRLIIVGQYKDMYYCANYLKKVFNNVMKENAEALGPVYLPKYKGVQVVLKHNNFEKVSLLIDEVEKKFAENKLVIQFERFPRNFS